VRPQVAPLSLFVLRPLCSTPSSCPPSRVQTDNKDPDIVEQSLIKVKEALVGGGGVPPRALTAADTASIVQGVMLCMSHKNGRVQTAALGWCAPASPASTRGRGSVACCV
jgi:hypothetical protein